MSVSAIDVKALRRELEGNWGFHLYSHTCEHLLIALKLPPPSEFPDRNAPIPWETDERLKYMRRGQDGDVMVAEVRETSRKPDEMYGVLER